MQGHFWHPFFHTVFYALLLGTLSPLFLKHLAVKKHLKMTGHFTGQTCQGRAFACGGRVRVLPCLPCYLVQTLIQFIGFPWNKSEICRSLEFFCLSWVISLSFEFYHPRVFFRTVQNYKMFQLPESRWHFQSLPLPQSSCLSLQNEHCRLLRHRELFYMHW